MKIFKRYKLSAVLAACLGTFMLAATAQAGQIDADLWQAMQNGGDVDFIVRFNDQLDLSSFPGNAKGKGMQRSALLWALRDQADVSQSDAVRLLRASGAKRLIQLWSINALAVTANPAAIEQLAALPGVDIINLDSSLTEPTPQAATAAVSEWNLHSIRAPKMWTAGYDGTGTVVASMDSGVDNLHPDLNASWRGGANSWFDPNGEHATPYDKTGHGTQTTSLMVGGGAGGSNIGVAPGAEWIAVKIFNNAGVASQSVIHQGFQWLLDPDNNPDTNDSPDVVNNSWGYPNEVAQCFDAFNADIGVLKAAGIAVVFSAGNQGSLGSVSPADNPESFAVGSVDASLNVANSSSRGPSACDGSFFPEVVAPGVNVMAADLTFGGLFPDSYVTVSGTSFAAPHVAGTMALLRQANPDATVAQIEQALTGTALDLGATGVDNLSGYGLINAVAANDWLTSNPNPDPVANFSSSCSDLDCSFTDLSTDSDGTIESWSWDFEDGNTSILQNPTNLYLSGGTYSVSLTVTDDDGATDNISIDVEVVEPETYTVGGSASGLAGIGLVLQNNAGDDLPVGSDGVFAFSTALTDGSDYAVTVKTQPTNLTQVCSVGNGSGTLAGASVTDVTVTCETSTFTVGGSVSGLAGTSLVLQNNAGDDLPVASEGDFVFGTALTDGSTFAVSVLTQPVNPGQSCSVSNGSGTLNSANITDVFVTCTSYCNINDVSGVTEYSDGSYEACEILVLGPDFIAADGANVSANSGREIEFLPGFIVEPGATLKVNVCGQSLCITSPDPMPYGCHSCVDQICDIDPSCCALEFNQACLDRVSTTCGLVCE